MCKRGRGWSSSAGAGASQLESFGLLGHLGTAERNGGVTRGAGDVAAASAEMHVAHV